MLDASLGEMVMEQEHIVILGAGISGLALAWFLKKQYGSAIRVTILEKNNRVGGWIQTIDHEGFLFEQGPRGCRPTGAGLETLRLIQELNMEDEVILNDPAATLRYLYYANNLKLIPNNLLGLLRTPWLLKMVFFPMLFEWKKAKGNATDESIYDFISRRLSPKIADYLIDPMASGIYAGDIRKLSIKSTFSQMYEWEQKHGSLSKGIFSGSKSKEVTDPFLKKMLSCSLFSLKGGMESLIKQLASKLDAEIRLNTPAEKLVIKQEGIEISTLQGVIQADHVFSTLSAQALAPLISPINDRLGSLISSVPSTSLAVVNVGYRSLKLKQNGFGYLIPSREKEQILGMVWDSSVFPQQNRSPDEVRLTVMLGGELFPEVIDLPETEIIAKAKYALAKHLGIQNPPDSLLIQRKRAAIPQYLVGHEQKIQSIKQELSNLSPNITLLGTSFNGVAVNECITTAKSAFIHLKDMLICKKNK